MSGFRFHPQALGEFQASALYYQQQAGQRIATTFVATIEGSIKDIASAPKTWPIIDEPSIRRYVCRRFPFVIYYRSENDGVVIYAIMHTSRQPNYWIDRLR